MSSIIATASKNIFRFLGIFLPNNPITPSAIAVSVEIGIAQPVLSGGKGFSAENIRAGTTIPPIAQKTKNDAFFHDLSSPSINSRFISRTTTKKNMAIKPSFIQCWRSKVIAPSVKSCCKKLKYALDHLLLAKINAVIAAIKIRMLLRLSSLRTYDKTLRGANFEIFLFWPICSYILTFV